MQFHNQGASTIEHQQCGTSNVAYEHISIKDFFIKDVIFTLKVDLKLLNIQIFADNQPKKSLLRRIKPLPLKHYYELDICAIHYAELLVLPSVELIDYTHKKN